MKSRRRVWCYLLACIILAVAVIGQKPRQTECAEEEAFVPSSVEAPEFSAQAGFYLRSFELKLSAPAGMKIYYTKDGSVPFSETSNTIQYKSPISLEVSIGDLIQASVIRAVAVDTNGERSDVVTNTYFVAPGMTTHYKVPVISLVTEPSALYDYETGLFENYDESGREWEREAHFEYFLPNGQREIAMNVGIRIHGAYSRRAMIKSLRLYARSEYDTQKNVKYDFFSDSIIPAVEKNGKEETITKFKRLILRTGGNEGDAWESVYFRDVLVQSLMADSKLDLQAYAPTVMFINGEFYGIINIRERMDDRYLSSHYNCSETDVVIYGFEYDKREDGSIILPKSGEAFETVVEEGDENEKSFFDEGYQYVVSNDLSVKANFLKACEYFDVDNLIDYLCVQIFSGNTDWPHNNARAWRYTGEKSTEYGLDGRIRWLVYDTDFGFGLYSHQSNENILQYMVKEVGKAPYMDVLSRLFRGFLQNTAFQKRFANRFLSLLDTNFSVQEIRAKIDKLARVYRPLVPEVYRKYGDRMDYGVSISIVREYVRLRESNVRQQVNDAFGEALRAPEVPDTEDPWKDAAIVGNPGGEGTSSGDPSVSNPGASKDPVSPKDPVGETTPGGSSQETDTSKKGSALPFVIVGVILLAAIVVIVVVQRKNKSR